MLSSKYPQWYAQLHKVNCNVANVAELFQVYNKHWWNIAMWMLHKKFKVQTTTAIN